MALRHHERNFATRSAHTLQAIKSHDTANHPAHQRRAAFTPACFALPSGTAPRKRTFHQGRANPHGTATSRTQFRHTVCPHTTSNQITRYRQSSRSPATRRVYTSMFRAPQWHGATQTHFPPRPRKSAWHCDITNANATRSAQTLEAIISHNTSVSSSATLFPVAPKGSFLHYICTTNWPLLSPAPKSTSDSPAPKSAFPHYICTTNWPGLSTNWPLLSPAPKGSFPYYICTTNWPPSRGGSSVLEARHWVPRCTTSFQRSLKTSH